MIVAQASTYAPLWQERREVLAVPRISCGVLMIILHMWNNDDLLEAVPKGMY